MINKIFKVSRTSQLPALLGTIQRINSNHIFNSKISYLSSQLKNKQNLDESAENNENSEDIHKEDDLFAKEFLKRQIKLSSTQKYILSFGSSLAALIDPTRHDMIACLGETTGVSALQTIYENMNSSTEGKLILIDKPRINTKTVNLSELKNLAENTFGRNYIKFLDDNKVTPDSRMDVRFMDDPELAYIMTRYRECHDLIHTILGMPTNMLGEVAVKWVEALNTGLPMCYGGAVFGAIRLRPKQRQKYLSVYLPWAISNGKRLKPLLNVYWEKRWEQDIAELRKELGIQVL
ncbi:ubiquinone biosynthesis protein COQ4 homolog, mitochondrial [Condylostylus longicornis]|uniref:ubiquinone biosynthesis protein COQ4 homolog, mitochondrial n=1 Tax=Condylostylus longicornis TaxID=2530218 RepID=UPI00244E05F5|nr:ubiquinone biosynthesis protein COQ4 homolog, mitochondrial [Condylostylus longicornis]XP_055376766.1 ubiquinone biosynthesis protein COQ4 homolog, mitochondrial [Condylostylus longicornis]XP_055376767.1 ubiquinone biosynthesis protein COQ4 homolog, mitochondrial [Condylostylus longicornis]XP_055376768.1 ubiquinone biosynthesis protein COQ4 homolog, mitochondrial [Condylostylus longicornis]